MTSEAPPSAAYQCCKFATSAIARIGAAAREMLGRYTATAERSIVVGAESKQAYDARSKVRLVFFGAGSALESVPVQLLLEFAALLRFQREGRGRAR